ncbi:23S rRNA (uracil(747)-C(5))-methyltransferase [Nocardioides psychrotolerans]|uniref:23S rRNA (Uracil747-C5)-methyltransferase n=1 Tax=Nocardioides psychrotolerans TaxID=1005945 RepID=A0A1I3PEQ1_9ACTN|nr:23S rRNA (uracil(747)-C(5))-methyltransferase RlmC [Nocardioides psychrotolerans]GEP39667.1 23S rRNA (uracil(747)-C(5))-methyltransferase [Nocardioides psychrotolerans]SFJ20018.1 23S rRNA (uracil747-C5)-methyltransferase [Nocardioides psychrotolerans]
MQCSYFDAGRCRSCSELDTAYDVQVRAKEDECRARLAALGGQSDALVWLPTVTSPEAGFRNKAKMVVAGTTAQPTLGILDPHGSGVDLRSCPLYSPAVHALLPLLADFVGTAALTPYDVATRRGELKHLLVTESPDGEFLLRFVLRTSESVLRIRKHLPGLLAAAPVLAVVSVNLQPEHKAVLEGEHEEVLTERSTLPMRVNDLVLQLPPRSFFQTNTALAAVLYRQAAAWADDVAPTSVLDLYCGVGGFALHLAAPGRRVVGVEASAEAVAGATATAASAGLTAYFVVGDATEWPVDADLVVVNPPRRGLGPVLASRLEESSARTVIYSSCNAASLATDLAAMPSWRPVEARLLDMFPHTRHYEVVTLLRRDQPAT